MGMESFFVNFEIPQIENPDEIIKYLKSAYHIQFYSFPIRRLFCIRRIVDKNQYTVNDRLILSIRLTDKTTIICLESCFANYHDNVAMIYEILQFLTQKYGHIAAFHSSHNYAQSLSFDGFKNWLNATHSQKRALFIKKYGEINENVLPGGDFYIYIRKKKII